MKGSKKEKSSPDYGTAGEGCQSTSHDEILQPNIIHSDNKPVDVVGRLEIVRIFVPRDDEILTVAKICGHEPDVVKAMFGGKRCWIKMSTIPDRKKPSNAIAQREYPIPTVRDGVPGNIILVEKHEKFVPDRYGGLQ